MDTSLCYSRILYAREIASRFPDDMSYSLFAFALYKNNSNTIIIN